MFYYYFKNENECKYINMKHTAQYLHATTILHKQDTNITQLPGRMRPHIN
jgi:hypothetical protein